MPRLLTDVSGADWVAGRLLPWRIPAGVPVGGVVPPGFASVVRVLHPAAGRRWAEVAVSRGRTMHALAQWCGIFPDFTRSSRSSEVDPEEGSVPQVTLGAVLDHCPADGDITYAVWCGSGQSANVIWPADR